MRRWTALLLVAVVAAACGTGAVTGSPGAGPLVPTGKSTGSAAILLGAPTSLDPAAAGDAGSAAVIAQLFETLTTFDTQRVLRPALADSWNVESGGTRVVFHLRPGLRFSDGSALKASDVVRSWLRLIDPTHPSPLASLMLPVRGAAERLRGRADPSTVGLIANDATGEVTVELIRPESDFVDIVSSPSFAVVPPGIDGASGLHPGDAFVASGGYRLIETAADHLTLDANPDYWAGTPAIREIRVVTDLGGKSLVEAFQAGTLDYTSIGEADATWVAYDQTLGPQLRQVPSLSTDYYGFDTSRPPFDDVRVRQAFAQAVDWRRIARLASSDPASVATSMVPTGIPGRSATDFVPLHDPAGARALLASAGYPGGAGFPAVTIVSAGGPYDEAVIGEIKRELGVTLRSETMGFTDFFGRLDTDPPAMWFLSWIADYPGRNDFLGVLLASGSPSDYGRWKSTGFDTAVADALAASDPASAGQAFDRAESIVQHDAPVIPVSYGGGWALGRDGLLGASENGLGFIRAAGLAWAP